MIEPKIMKEIRAIFGSGRLRFRNQTYKIKLHPLGQDFAECDVRPEESLVLVNLDHPAYEQGVEENCIEITVFRAIAARFAQDNSETPDEMYEKLDSMIRFHARRTNRRKNKSKEKLDEESGELYLLST
jgi:hypothetical protein